MEHSQRNSRINIRSPDQSIQSKILNCFFSGRRPWQGDGAEEGDNWKAALRTANIINCRFSKGFVAIFFHEKKHFRDCYRILGLQYCKKYDICPGRCIPLLDRTCLPKSFSTVVWNMVVVIQTSWCTSKSANHNLLGANVTFRQNVLTDMDMLCNFQINHYLTQVRSLSALVSIKLTNQLMLMIFECWDYRYQGGKY